MRVSPHAEFNRIRDAMQRCGAAGGAVRFSGHVYRSAEESYAQTPDLLTGEGSRIHGGRWNAPETFAVVYASATPETAFAESLAHFRHYGIPVRKALPRTVVAIEVRLSHLLDLRDGAVRRRLAVSNRRLQADRWRDENEAGRESLTQTAGRGAYEAGFEGLIVPSACDGWNLAVFPERLRRASGLRRA